MKKLILILIIISGLIPAASIMGQSLQLKNGSDDITNGTVFHVWGDTGTGMSITGILIKNISSNSVSVKSKKIENVLIPGAKCSMCFAQNCYLSSTYISTSSVSILPGSLDNSFTGDYSPKGNLGESIITFVFFNVNNINDSAWIVVHFNGVSSSGIDENTLSKIDISNAYPNPAVNYTSFNYSFPVNTLSARFVLRDLLGSIVKETEIYDKEGKLIINTNQIKDGVYFYNFYVNDKMILTKKLIIRH